MPQTVDTSMYGNLAVPKPPNPLDTLSTAAGTINAMNQNRLFGQTFAARQAIGQAYQAATDPNTGILDANKLNALVANNPRAAFMAPEVAQQELERQKAQLDIKTQQLNLGLNHAKAMGGYFAQLAANPNLSMKDVTGAATEMVAEGLATPQEVAAELANAPQDSGGLHQWALGHYQRYMGLQGQLEAALPKPTIINTGPQNIVADTNPLTNPGIIGAHAQNALTPDQLSAPVTVTVKDATGTHQQTMTKAQFLQMQGGGGMPPGSTGLPAPTQPAPPAGGVPAPAAPQPSPLGTGRIQAPQAPAAQPGASPGVPSSPPLGAEAAANTAATASAEQGVALQKAADTVPQQKALLGNLEAALGQFTSGPGADWKKVGTAFANTILPDGLQIHPEAIASQEEFNKQALQLAQQQFQTLGGTGTDAKLDSTMHTSPNEALSKLGNEGIIQLLKGNADAIAVKNQEWQKWLSQGHGPETYGQFSTQFNKTYDPRVFQSTYMSTRQRQEMLKGMTGAEQTQFRKSYNQAVDNGWIPDPRQQNVQPGQ